jgi:hypothetical protein
MLRTQNNQKVAATLVGVARAHVQYPGFEMSKAKAAAERVDRALADEQHMHATVALVILLLKAMGIAEPGDVSLFSRH